MLEAEARVEVEVAAEVAELGAAIITPPVSSDLEQLLQRIRPGNCKLEYADADLLLRNRENAAVQEAVLSRQYANRVHPSGSCTFFKQNVPTAPKMPKDDWVECKVSNSFSLTSNKSGQPFRSATTEYEGVARQSSTITNKEARARMGHPAIGVFFLVALPGHRNWDTLESASGQDASWRYLDSERLVLVHASVQPEAKRNEAFGTVEVDVLLIKGVSIWEELEKLKADMQQQRSDSDFADRVFAPGPSGSDHRADLGEWMEFCPDEQLPRPGDVVECLGHGDEQPRISLNITHAAGSTLFVVSSDPAWAGNMPQDKAHRSTGAVVAFLGRVPVAVHGEADINSFLVPSTLCDGTARAVGEQELRESLKLRSQCFGIVWAKLPPDASGRPMVLAFVSAHPQLPPAFGEFRGVEQLAPLSSTLVPSQRPQSKELRPYQEACVEYAIAENAIVNLGTGLGKTLIAIKLIDHFRRLNPGQHVLFIVPNTALVRQQAEAVRRDGHTSPRVAELCGSTIDSWGAAAWEACLRANDVLLGTPQTFFNAIYTSAHVQLSQFSLFVFDECHEYATWRLKR